MKRSSICPFCFEKIKLHKVDFRCTNDPKRCVPENDAVLANFLGMNNIIINKVVKLLRPTTIKEKIKSWLVMPIEATCHACQEKTSIRLCPHCHSELPYTMGNYKGLIFAVIGAKEAGKSHYISVLIDKIRNEVGANFDCSLHPLNDETIQRYREDFYNPVFRQHETIQATISGRANVNIRKPLIYTLSFRGTKKLTRKIREIVTLVFFDTAGEDLDEENTMRTENKYIYNSSGIILLLDPLQLAKVRTELPPNTPKPSKNSETEDLLNRVANLIRRAHRMKASALIDIPLAVAFSKIDALEPLLEGSSLNYPSQHNGYFNLNEFENVKDEMESRVREWSGESLIQSLKHSFKEHAFFGLTALGCNPHNSHKIDKLRPRRVEEPFLWLLWKHKLISNKLNFFTKLKQNISLSALLSVVVVVISMISIMLFLRFGSLNEVFQSQPKTKIAITDEAKKMGLFNSTDNNQTTGHKKNWLNLKLQTCQKHLNADRLTTGDGGHNGTAFSCYKKVLGKYPTNSEALEGLKQIEKRYISLIEKYLAKSNDVKARKYMDRLRQINPNSHFLNK